MDELKKRKTPRYPNFDYSAAGAYFITICTQNRRCILSCVVGTGVLDCPSDTGVLDCPSDTGVLDCPSDTGVLDCPQIKLTRYGEIADKYIKQLNDFYVYLSVEKYVIMPNHIHLLLWVKENGDMSGNGQSGTPVPTNLAINTPGNGQSGTPVPTNLAINTPDNGQSGTPVPTRIERANSACSRFVSTFKRFCNKEYGENIWQARFYDHIIRNGHDYEEHVKYIYENPARWYYDELYAEE